MKTTHQILGILWMAICGYFFVSLVRGIYEHPPSRLVWLVLELVFVSLYLVGTFASFFLLLGSKWGRIVVGIAALLTVTASVMGLFAFFNSPPFSVVGVMFDVFALVSAGALLLSRRHVPA